MVTYNITTYPVSGKMYFEGVCLSTDAKPTGGSIMNGSKLTEMDTGKLFLYDEANETWREFA